MVEYQINMGKTFFTGDTHFSHANIIVYSRRPQFNADEVQFDAERNRESWKDRYVGRQRAKEMDSMLEANWNSKVTSNDDVIHLGDIHFGRTDKLIQLLRRLNFKNLYIIWGNHDTSMKDFKTIIHFYPDLKDRIHFLGNMEEISIEGQKIVLCHYAMRVWNKAHRGAWHLYGHSHGSLEGEEWGKSFDVGVDANNYFPISFEEVRERMNKRTFKQVDHHSGKVSEEMSEFTMRE